MPALAYTIIPVVAVIAGALLSLLRKPGASFVSAMQHLAAGVVFAAAATEILPQIKHDAAPVATLIGGAIGVGAMLLLKALEERATGSLAMVGAVAIDILVDGLVLGLAFLAGAKAGLLLTIALTLEVMFLGVTVTSDLREKVVAAWKVVAIVAAIGMLLPVGAVLATPVAVLPQPMIVAFLSFGLMALLYLVTEELLVDAHERPDSPLISGMFFAGFLGLLIIEELM
ncbi:transporter [Sphingomonas sp. C8-2]|jgi:ZIP family zinc transporter|uniref:ZIP family metal transporter n=1 Tax=Sphingomonas sp. KC8 TaxID=1030157 RepID=UPI0002489859|nr:transporter [Sphingomonas sp. KC8]ARS26423.1 transporter [Sphingomonas sp. KC8]QEH78400.1 transporter [Sphingomonas sp. C8-2]